MVGGQAEATERRPERLAAVDRIQEPLAFSLWAADRLCSYNHSNAPWRRGLLGTRVRVVLPCPGSHRTNASWPPHLTPTFDVLIAHRRSRAPMRLPRPQEVVNEGVPHPSQQF